MTTVAKSTPVGSLGLGPGDHVVRIHVGEDSVSFDIESSTPPPASGTARRPTGFVRKWSGTARKVEDPSDDWLTHINEKHLR